MEALLRQLKTSYEALGSALGAFGESLYGLGIKETEDSLRHPLMNSGLLARSMGPPVKDTLLVELESLRSSCEVQTKAVQDARSTREQYRQARLRFDSAKRLLQEATDSRRPTEQLEVDKQVLWEKYQEQADALKTKVMLLHQYRIRSMQEQLRRVQATFLSYFTLCESKLPGVQQPHAAEDASKPHTKALTELLSK